ncbi:MAG: galactokinase [Planctomycetes bacterium]|nr:galactokinase [Planctomycetota bacterium]
MNALQLSTIDAFRRVFGTTPACVAFAPGRVEVLGNHTDYNGGCVLSVALDLGVAAAACLRPGPPRAEVWSEAFGEMASFALEDVRREGRSWSNYPRGVVRELERSGVPLKGFRMLIASSLPIGSGVSSSAALELATAEALYGLFGGRPAKPMDEAQLCQRAEAGFVGVPCGLLDQFSSLFGRKDHVLFLDCATLRHMQVPLGRDDLRVVLCDTGEKHALVDGKYAALRASCERARDRFAQVLSHEVRFLRDVSPPDFEAWAQEIDEGDRPRAEHVIRENERVIRGLAAVKSKVYDELGRLMLASHASSRDLFGNSTEALDLLVEAAAGTKGLVGAKLTGGGFGGSTVNLVERGAERELTERLARRFEGRFGRRPKVLATGIGDGARVESL